MSFYIYENSSNGILKIYAFYFMVLYLHKQIFWLKSQEQDKREENDT